VNNIEHQLGYFITAKEAAIAHDNAARKYWGPKASTSLLNFPHHHHHHHHDQAEGEDSSHNKACIPISVVLLFPLSLSLFLPLALFVSL